MATFRALGGFDGHIKIDVGRADDDFVAGMAGDQGQEVAEEIAGLIGILVHLPVGGHQLFAGHEVLSRNRGALERRKTNT